MQLASRLIASSTTGLHTNGLFMS